jgi:hypothetical protein
MTGRSNRDYEKEITRQQFKIAELETFAHYLNMELNKQQRLKQQIKSLYRSIDNKVIRTIDQKGYTRERRETLAKFPSIDLSGQSREELMKAARLYDTQAYFHYYPLHENMKLHYRALSKLYRTTRNITEKSAKKSYRLTKRVKG